MASPTYYLVKRDPVFDMRQERYREHFEAGREHPHDLCAVGLTAAQMRELVQHHGFDVDTKALEAP